MIHKKPLVYIVLPCYNGEKYLLEQLMSIYYQDYTNWYLIFVNDGSTDNSETIARDFISHYNLHNKVKIINKENGGLNSAIQRGLEEIKKLYDIHNTDNLVAYCDADDIRTRNKLEYQVNYMIKNPEYGLTCHNGISINDNGELLSAKYINNSYRKEEFPYIATIGNRYNGPTMIFKIKCIDYILPMPLGKSMAQDYWTALVLGLHNVKIQFLDKKLYCRRMYQGSMQRILDKKNLDEKGKVRMEYFSFLQQRFLDKDLSYIVGYNRDRYIVWQQKGYGRIKIYFNMLLKYPKIFFWGLKAQLRRFFNYISFKK